MLLQKFVFPLMLKTTHSSSFSDTLANKSITVPTARAPRSFPFVQTMKQYFSTHYQRAIKSQIDSLLP